MLWFRTATFDDLEEIMRVIEEARAAIRKLGIDQWQNGTPNRDFMIRDIKNKNCYVLAEDTTVAAIAVMIPENEAAYDRISGSWHADGPYLCLHRVAVDDAHRHQGIAPMLIAEAKHMAKKRGLKSIRIDTHTGNTVMRSFLIKQGFAECGVVRYDLPIGDPYRVAYDLVL